MKIHTQEELHKSRSKFTERVILWIEIMCYKQEGSKLTLFTLSLKLATATVYLAFHNFANVKVNTFYLGNKQRRKNPENGPA